MKKNKNSNVDSKKKALKGCLIDSLLPGFFFLIFIYNVSFRLIETSLLGSKGVTTYGVITKEKHAIANSKVSNETSYNYGYEFEVDKKIYTGNSHTREFSIGTQVKIEYVPFYPQMNRMAK
jgi:hypothetical protein